MTINKSDLEAIEQELQTQLEHTTDCEEADLYRRQIPLLCAEIRRLWEKLERLEKGGVENYHKRLGLAVVRFLEGSAPEGLPEGRSISKHFEIGGAYEDWGYRVKTDTQIVEDKDLLLALEKIEGEL